MHDESTSFNNYFWSKQDVIGAGATSIVYKAICNETGTYAAVKVFNDQAKLRSNTIQTRELDLLHKINHENVVKLIDKEESITPHKYSLKLIVMEYCNGGSLATLIEEPENMYGLQQDEFLLVLKHITSGMNELHKLKIVHRDIKPNNILLQILPTGEHVYKLSDFGAAREVEMEDDQFTSICGTEEYLFPDVYERALINRNIQRSFRAEIDLWSTGVTLYHVATGILPFRPLGGRTNRETMIKITRDKPSGYISGVQNPISHLIEYSERLPETCQLSKNLQNLLVPMLAGLMENSYENMWRFKEFFEHSSEICELKFVNVMNLDTCQIVEIPMRKSQTLNDLKIMIQKETKIDVNSQLIIFNNLLIESVVTETQLVDTYPIMDKQRPCVLFSLNSSLSCDNLEVVKPIPPISFKDRPKRTIDILGWSKETCGVIYYIKREIYLVTNIIELLKLSAIALKSYMPEMKLKNQNLLHNFKCSVKSLETKLSIMEKLEECAQKANISLVSSKNDRITNSDDYNNIKQHLSRYKDEISIYEGEINFLTDKLNETQNLEFLVQNSTSTNKWRNEADAYANTAQLIYNEFMQKKKELRYKTEQEKFETSKFTEFKINSVIRTKEEAVKLFQEVIIVNFYDFFLKFEKWMSDLIKLHNDIMSVHQKLIECDKALNTPYEFQRIDLLIDTKINSILEIILAKKMALERMEMNNANHNTNNNNHHLGSNRMLYSPATPPQTICSNSSSKNNSIEIRNGNTSSTSSSAIVSNFKDDNNNSNHILNNMISFKLAHVNLDSAMINLKDFKLHLNEITKAVDENIAQLKYLDEKMGHSASNSANTSATSQQFRQIHCVENLGNNNH